MQIKNSILKYYFLLYIKLIFYYALKIEKEIFFNLIIILNDIMELYNKIIKLNTKIRPVAINSKNKYLMAIFF